MTASRLAATDAAAFCKKENPLLLAIETSCDETAAAVLRGRRDVLGMSVHSQIPLHRKYGGVVPEIASRSHVERVGPVCELALREAGVDLHALDAIAVTLGPGLVGALLVGVSYAKGLAYALGLPLIGVNHLSGHIAANYLSHEALKPPYACLVASGGHSHIVHVSDWNRFELLGCTRDDAAGEAFDKVARVVGLGYPGGPALEALAKEGDPARYRFHSAFNEGPGLDFSFSGIKTAVVNLVHNAHERGETLNRADVCASFQHAVVTALTEKSVRAAMQRNATQLALAGGVSANMALRGAMERAADAAGLRFFCPEMRFCTDNAAMIAAAGYLSLMEGATSPLSLNALPALALA